MPIRSEKLYNQINILSTRPLTASLVEKAAADNIIIETLSFIKTEPVTDPALIQEVRQLFARDIVAVFTSMNAAEAVASLLEEAAPGWKIFALGNTTRNIVQEKFPQSETYGGGENASALAAEVVNAGNIDKVIFFCGDQRRDELPAILQTNGIAVRELIVYKTHRQRHMLQKSYDGIMFFSPSAVESFFETNSICDGTILFAIGNTTAKTIEQYSTNKVITSDHPGKEALVKKLILHFTTINQH